MSKYLAKRRALREALQTKDARKLYEEMDRERMVRAHYEGVALAEEQTDPEELGSELTGV